ncbi:MAG: hypothetical protein ACHQZR_03725 [Candidatus Limnocylindrales bacterium]
MDAPFRLSDGRLQARLLACIDVEDKIPRALELLGTMVGRRVLLLDARRDSFRARQLEVMGARVATWPGLVEPRSPAATAPDEPPEDGFDVAVGWWIGFQGTGPDATAGLAAAERALAPGGRLLLVQDYGRDETSALYADEAREARLRAWSDRMGPVLGAGFRVRTLHCWWTFPDLAAAADMLGRAFPATGPAVAAAMTRPRLAYKVAVYHRVLGNRRVAS